MAFAVFEIYHHFELGRLLHFTVHWALPHAKAYQRSLRHCIDPLHSILGRPCSPVPLTVVGRLLVMAKTLTGFFPVQLFENLRECARPNGTHPQHIHRFRQGQFGTRLLTCVWIDRDQTCMCGELLHQSNAEPEQPAVR